MTEDGICDRSRWSAVFNSSLTSTMLDEGKESRGRDGGSLKGRHTVLCVVELLCWTTQDAATETHLIKKTTWTILGYWIGLTSASAGSSEFSSSVSNSSTARLTDPRLLANISWMKHKQLEETNKPASKRNVQYNRDSLGLSYLEAVLIWHKLLCFALVAPLGCSPRCLRGQSAPRGFVGTFTQVHVRYTCTHVIRYKVLELEKHRV